MVRPLVNPNMVIVWVQCLRLWMPVPEVPADAALDMLSEIAVPVDGREEDAHDAKVTQYGLIDCAVCLDQLGWTIRVLLTP